MSILRNGHVAVSNLRVKTTIISLPHKSMYSYAYEQQLQTIFNSDFIYIYQGLELMDAKGPGGILHRSLHFCYIKH